MLRSPLLKRFWAFTLLVIVVMGVFLWAATERIRHIENTLIVEVPLLDRQSSWLLLDIERLEKSIRLAQFDPREGRIDQFTQRLDIALVRVSHVLSILESVGQRQEIVDKTQSLLLDFEKIIIDQKTEPGSEILKSMAEQLANLSGDLKALNVDLNNETLFAIAKQATELKSFNYLMIVAVALVALALLVIIGLLYRQQTISKQALDAKQEAEEATRAKSYFLAAMSHELRTPLNAILGFAQMMGSGLHGPLGSKRYDEYVKIIDTSGNHLLNLVNDILDLSAVEAGKFDLNIETFDIEALLEECERLISGLVSERDLRFELTKSELPLTLVADPRAIKQILINLLSNAIKFTDAGKSVRLVVQKQNECILFQVIDQGSGISKNHLADITKPFVTHEKNPTIAHEGTGLGLAIVDALTKLHNGTMEIWSKLGEGTIVSVKIPMLAELSEDEIIENKTTECYVENRTSPEEMKTEKSKDTIAA